jgi:hypothetical protein
MVPRFDAQTLYESLGDSDNHARPCFPNLHGYGSHQFCHFQQLQREIGLRVYIDSYIYRDKYGLKAWVLGPKIGMLSQNYP